MVITILIIAGLAIVAFAGFIIYKKAVSDKSSVLDEQSEVTQKQLDDFVGSCQNSVTRIIRVLVRFDLDVHEQVNELAEAMDRIIRNVQEDPKDIEYSFVPESMSAAATHTEEYARLYRDREHLSTDLHLKEFPRQLPETINGFKEIFVKMQEANLFDLGYKPAALVDLMKSDVVLQHGSGVSL